MTTGYASCRSLRSPPRCPALPSGSSSSYRLNVLSFLVVFCFLSLFALPSSAAKDPGKLDFVRTESRMFTLATTPNARPSRLNKRWSPYGLSHTMASAETGIAIWER
ncbi:hypothetical protein LZ31DRAFT_551342, partial [Colletotrichum somersetense]